MKNEKMIIESNCLIAEFLGYESYTGNGYRNFIFSDDNHRTDVDLHYHHDWNWLMPVVDKIEEIEGVNNITEGYDVTICRHQIWIQDFDHNNVIVDLDGYDQTKIEVTFDAVVEFIKWYNKQTKND
jgi:hypothetical protein